MDQQSYDGNNLETQTKISIFSIIIGIIGFFLSLYALIVHIQLLLKSGLAPVCDFTTTVGCSNVIGSSYGEIAAIPLGAWGMAYFAIILSAALLPKFCKVNLKWLANLELIIAVVGFFSVSILFYISYFILKMLCPNCSAIHVTVVIYAVLKVNQFFKTRSLKQSESSNALVTFLAVSLCLGIPPLAAGLLSPILVNYFKDSSSVSSDQVKNNTTTDANNSNVNIQSQTPEVTPPQSPQSPQPPAPENLLVINKTNYVGNGEDYRRGDDNSKVIVQVFSDYGCPHCKTATDAIIKAQDIVGLDKVLFVYRFFPLSNQCNPYVPSSGGYPYSCSLAEATRCAGQQNKFWEFKSWAFSGQYWDNQERAKSFSLAGMQSYAASLGMDVNAFTFCVENHVELQKLKDDAVIANKLNIQGTPLILINGTPYEGAHTGEAFVQAYIQRLQKLN